MASIEERLRAVEDRLEILNVISAYGPAVDGCNVEAMDRVYAEDGVYDVRDYERLPETLKGLHFAAFACLMLNKAVAAMLSS